MDHVGVDAMGGSEPLDAVLGGHRVRHALVIALGPVVAVGVFLLELPLADRLVLALGSPRPYGLDVALAAFGLALPLVLGSIISALGVSADGVTGRRRAMVIGLAITAVGALVFGVALWALGLNVQRSS